MIHPRCRELEQLYIKSLLGVRSQTTPARVVTHRYPSLRALIKSYQKSFFRKDGHWSERELMLVTRSIHAPQDVFLHQVLVQLWRLHRGRQTCSRWTCALLFTYQVFHVLCVKPNVGGSLDLQRLRRSCWLPENIVHKTTYLIPPPQSRNRYCRW